ncbi:MAG: H-NS histone family protein [Rhodocyclaceae bacterium]|nr:H-NS histone family protein [Rhodocyclaceae bacterium]
MQQNHTYAELKQQIVELERQAEAARQAEVAAVVADIRRKIAEYGLTAADLGFGAASGAVKRKARQSTSGARLTAGRYRNPQGGEIYEYQGRGRKPAWLAAMTAEEIDRCRIS